MPVYAAMIESVDESVGRIADALKAKGIYGNTIFIFYSDNGPTTDNVLRTPFRGGKNSTCQGGLREPAFMVWPDKIPAGTQSDAFVTICDLPYTMLDAAGYGAFYIIKGCNVLPYE